MASRRLSVRIEPGLQSSLRRRATLAQKSESVIVREALETYLAAVSEEASAYDLALKAGVIGCAKPAPRDLSTNPKHLKGFGENR
jgi:predicted DNA-binding protein